MQQATRSQVNQRLYRDIPSVLAVVLMLFVFADIFVKTGISEVSTINSFVTAMYPISIPMG